MRNSLQKLIIEEMSSDLHALVRREFEARLWAVRNVRGQA